MPTPLCTSCTRRSLSPCPRLNLIHYKSREKSSLHFCKQTKSAGYFVLLL
ncbi:hypothetical protein QG053_02760 [Kingella kingae]|nr:hypothetical protein [Kingella kingae]MDK4535492.1 hypothetical protein [Kingella kingae]MDK4538924.1 hypothetical protein [Kingella kingae]MDK4563984.1 hypothetical protein [Kingella kingae]